jgi:hypothetical protein
MQAQYKKYSAYKASQRRFLSLAKQYNGQEEGPLFVNSSHVNFLSCHPTHNSAQVGAPLLSHSIHERKAEAGGSIGIYI